jgi:hypothetical protein
VTREIARQYPLFDNDGRPIVVHDLLGLDDDEWLDAWLYVIGENGINVLSYDGTLWGVFSPEGDAYAVHPDADWNSVLEVYEWAEGVERPRFRDIGWGL